MEAGAWSSGAAPRPPGPTAGARRPVGAGEDGPRRAELSAAALKELQTLETQARAAAQETDEAPAAAARRSKAKAELEKRSAELFDGRLEDIVHEGREHAVALSLLRIIIDHVALTRPRRRDRIHALRKSLIEIYRSHRERFDPEDRNSKVQARWKNMCDLATLCITRIVEKANTSTLDIEVLHDLELLARENATVGSHSYRLALRAMNLTQFVVEELGNVHVSGAEVPDEDKHNLDVCLRYALRIIVRPRKQAILQDSERVLLNSQWLTLPWPGMPMLADTAFKTEMEGGLAEIERRITKALGDRHAVEHNAIFPAAMVIEAELRKIGWVPDEREQDVWRKNTTKGARAGIDVVRGREALHALWLRCCAPSRRSAVSSGIETGDGRELPQPVSTRIARAKSSGAISPTESSRTLGGGSEPLDEITCTPRSILMLGAACLAFTGYPSADNEDARRYCIRYHHAVPSLVKAASDPDATLPAVRIFLVSFLEQHLSASALEAEPGLRQEAVRNVAHLMSLFSAVCNGADTANFKVQCFGIWTYLVAAICPDLLADLKVWDLITAPIFCPANVVLMFEGRPTNQVWMATFLFRASNGAGDASTSARNSAPTSSLMSSSSTSSSLPKAGGESSATPAEQPKPRQRDKFAALKDADLSNPVDITQVRRPASLTRSVWSSRLEVSVYSFLWAKGLALRSSRYIVCEEMIKTFPAEGLAAIERDYKLLRIFVDDLSLILRLSGSLDPDKDASWLWQALRTTHPGADVLARNLDDSIELLERCLPANKRERSLKPMIRTADKNGDLVKQLRTHSLLVRVLSYHGLAQKAFSAARVMAILRELASEVRSSQPELRKLAAEKKNLHAGLAVLTEEPSFARDLFTSLLSQGVTADLRSSLFDEQGEMLHEVVLLLQRTSRVSVILAAKRLDEGGEDYIDLAAMASQDSLVSEPGTSRGEVLFWYPEDTQRVTIGKAELARVSDPEQHFTDDIVQLYFQWCMLEEYPEQRSAIEASIFCFDALFFSKMLAAYETEGLSEVHKAVANWYASPGADIFDRDIWVMPVVYEEHWSLLLVCDVRSDKPSIVHLDSYGSHEGQAFENFGLVLRKFWKERWRLTHPAGDSRPPVLQHQDTAPPRQENSHDCGPFICKYFDRLVHDVFVAKQVRKSSKSGLGRALAERIDRRWFKTKNQEGRTVGEETRKKLRDLILEKAKRAGESAAPARPSVRAHTRVLRLLIETAPGPAAKEQIWRAVHGIEIVSPLRTDGFAEGLVRVYHELMAEHDRRIVSEIPGLLERIGPSSLNDVICKAIEPVVSERSSDEEPARAVCEAVLTRMMRLTHPGSPYGVSESEWRQLSRFVARARDLVAKNVWSIFVHKCKPPHALREQHAGRGKPFSEAALWLDSDNDNNEVGEVDTDNSESAELDRAAQTDAELAQKLDLAADNGSDDNNEVEEIDTDDSESAELDRTAQTDVELAQVVRRDAKEKEAKVASRPLLAPKLPVSVRGPPKKAMPAPTSPLRKGAKRARFDSSAGASIDDERAQAGESLGLEMSEGPERGPIHVLDTRDIAVTLDMIAGDKRKLGVYAGRFLKAAKAKWRELEQARGALNLLPAESGP